MRALVLLVALALLAQCTSTSIKVVSLPASSWKDAQAGDMPAPEDFCKLPWGGAECVADEVLRKQSECQARYQAEAWKRSQARLARDRHLEPVDAPIATTVVEGWRGNMQTSGDWVLDGEGPLHELTDSGKARFGDTMVAPLPDERSYLGRLGDAYVVVVPEYRVREERVLSLCCPQYGCCGTQSPEYQAHRAAVLPAGATFGGIIKLPVYTFALDTNGKTSWTGDEQRRHHCPAPPP